MMLSCRSVLITLIAFSVLGLGGCPKAGYRGVVTAHIYPQPVDSVRSALLGLGGFEGPKPVRGATPNCGYYVRRLARLPSEIGVVECYGPTEASETGWGYWVSLSTWPGRDPGVREEIDKLIEEIRQVIQARVGDAKVTKETKPVALE